MGVVDMQNVLVREVLERAVLGLVLGADVLHGRRNQKILLFQPQRLPGKVVILRIEHLGDGLRHRDLFHRFQVIAARKRLHIERNRTFRLP